MGHTSRPFLVLLLITIGCSGPTCPCDRLVPLEVAGVLLLDGIPIVAAISVWDNHSTDNESDDTHLWGDMSGEDGQFRLVGEVRGGGAKPMSPAA